MIVCQRSTLMGARRMNQSRLAELTGIHQDTLRKLYRNSWTSIRRDALDHLCSVLWVRHDAGCEQHQREPAEARKDGLTPCPLAVAHMRRGTPVSVANA
jgi:DNA-binding Xre family transcriptional regulator